MSAEAKSMAPTGQPAPLERSLVVGLCLLAFFTMFTYAVINSLAQVTFLSRFGSSQLPWVWLAVALATACATALLGALSQKLDIVALFYRAAWLSSGALAVVLLLASSGHSAGVFALYVYKDIYIIVLVELFWTFSNVAFGVTQASHTYGLFCAAGSLGSIVGNLGIGLLGEHVGNITVLWLMLPILPALGEGCRRLARGMPLSEPSQKFVKKGGMPITLGCKAVRNSHYLSWLMLLVALAQGVLTLVDFEFSRHVELSFTDALAQRRTIGLMYAIINTVSFVLQLMTARWLVWAGLARTFLVLPIGLGLGTFWALLQPGLMSWSFCQVVGKSLDYSLFRAAKELLYIPLSYVEKTQGKAAIDILTYRVAKGLGSVLLLVLGALGIWKQSIGPIVVILCTLWLITARIILLRHRTVLAARAQAAVK